MSKHCKFCGSTLSPGQDFCEKCGTKVDNDQFSNDEKGTTNFANNFFSGFKNNNSKISGYSFDKINIIDGAISGIICYLILLLLCYITDFLLAKGIISFLINLNILGLVKSVNFIDLANFSLFNTYNLSGLSGNIILNVRLVILLILPFISVLSSLYVVKIIRKKISISYDYIISSGLCVGIINLILIIINKKINWDNTIINFSYAYSLFIIPILIFIISYICSFILYKGQFEKPAIGFLKQLKPIYKKIFVLSSVLVLPMIILIVKLNHGLVLDYILHTTILQGLNVFAYIILSFFGIPININSSNNAHITNHLFGLQINTHFSFVAIMLYLMVTIGVLYLLYTYFRDIQKENGGNLSKTIKVIVSLAFVNFIIAFFTKISLTYNIPGYSDFSFIIGVRASVAFTFTLLLCGIIVFVNKYLGKYIDNFINIIEVSKKKFYTIYVVILFVLSCINVFTAPTPFEIKDLDLDFQLHDDYNDSIMENLDNLDYIESIRNNIEYNESILDELNELKSALDNLDIDY